MHDEKIIMHTQPYPHVVNVLSKLYENNISMAIATNKRQVPTIKLIDHFGWENYFQFIECTDSESVMRDKDAMIQDILKAEHKFNEAIFVGDTVNDGLSANLNQLPFIKANYGYGRDQDWSNINIKKTIASFSEIRNLII
jgi:phosphoglycolate phosphatase